MSREKGGIVGKFPNSDRHEEPIGQGSDEPIIVPNDAGKDKVKRERKSEGRL